MQQDARFIVTYKNHVQLQAHTLSVALDYAGAASAMFDCEAVVTDLHPIIHPIAYFSKGERTS